MVTAGSIYYLQPRTPDTGGTTAVVRTTPIEPGKEGATLTLEDGTVVALDSLGNGMIAGANATLQNGQLAYAPDGKSTAWNTITTPKARQFRIVLPDGTTVWLNAATSLRFPTAFPGGERKVALQGEAYFEVAKNTKQPFRVNLGDTASVEVLGTDFNINAYTDEPAVRTTLLSGSVRVRQKQEAIQLQPGQQAVMQKQLSVDKNANIEGVTAWKSGKFYFEGVSLEEFMRQVTRWYDIEVEYKGSTPQMRLKGKPGRDLDLQDLLDGLAELGIRYKMEGRKLIIL
ncbi:FecR domain-containing protein [Chitinophaga sedimenti]|uniref:FecR family protein n=1 Tax=Chitinophaga sedimenti TaxID=2033606 RepID=UPI00200485E6|nr:FecR family protein [Chitinophaga sedimenti]MCK7556288.1 FecR domain-containing protein [Chitinophaga sedimenti]